MNLHSTCTNYKRLKRTFAGTALARPAPRKERVIMVAAILVALLIFCFKVW